MGAAGGPRAELHCGRHGARRAAARSRARMADALAVHRAVGRVPERSRPAPAGRPGARKVPVRTGRTAGCPERPGPLPALRIRAYFEVAFARKLFPRLGARPRRA
ncbi:hypothetical protein Ate01nite_05590 [Actinoplanes teichomyceticus]|nr:hypothetical protein Ate01nite_05590 [Actinoplanes teichomyceticus]